MNRNRSAAGIAAVVHVATDIPLALGVDKRLRSVLSSRRHFVEAQNVVLLAFGIVQPIPLFRFLSGENFSGVFANERSFWDFRFGEQP